MRYVVQCEGVTVKVADSIIEALHEARKLLEGGLSAHVFPWTEDYLFKV